MVFLNQFKSRRLEIQLRDSACSNTREAQFQSSILQLKTKQTKAREMAQSLKVPATKPEDLSLILRTPTSCPGFSNLHTCSVAGSHPTPQIEKI